MNKKKETHYCSEELSLVAKETDDGRIFISKETLELMSVLIDENVALRKELNIPLSETVQKIRSALNKIRGTQQ